MTTNTYPSTLYAFVPETLALITIPELFSPVESLLDILENYAIVYLLG